MSERTALVVLNPRAIPEVNAALETLPIDLIRLVGMSEARIVERWGDVLDAARYRGYSHLSVISDDAVVKPLALAAVLAHTHLPVVTGYCNLDVKSTLVNLCEQPLPESGPGVDAYSLPTVWDVLEGPKLRRTFFTGMCLTTMSTAMWARFPFGVYDPHMNGCASDFHLSLRLQQEGIPIMCHKDAFVYHLKEVWNTPDKASGRELLIGKVPEAIVLP